MRHISFGDFPDLTDFEPASIPAEDVTTPPIVDAVPDLSTFVPASNMVAAQQVKFPALTNAVPQVRVTSPAAAGGLPASIGGLPTGVLLFAGAILALALMES